MIDVLVLSDIMDRLICVSVMLSIGPVILFQFPKI